MTNLSAIPGSFLLVRLDAATLAAVPIGDPLEDAARRWVNGLQRDGDEQVLRAWLAVNRQYEVTGETGQLVLFPAPRLKPAA